MSRIDVGRSKRKRSVRIQLPGVEGEDSLGQTTEGDSGIETGKVLVDHE